MPPAPDISTLNTAPIHALFAAMAARVLAYMDSGASLYKKALRARRLAQLGRLLLSMERYNRDVILKASMLACPQWRRRVFYDLGGWHGLWRWQARYLAASRGDAGHQSPEWWAARQRAAASVHPHHPPPARAAAPLSQQIDMNSFAGRLFRAAKIKPAWKVAQQARASAHRVHIPTPP